MNKLWIAPFLVFVLMSYIGTAQTTISGTITGSDTRETLPQVNVIVKGTTTGTVSDLDGNFSITLPEGSNTLVFSFVGYDNKEVTVEEGTTALKIVLDPADVGLNTIVVSASRKEERILDAPASVTVINAEAIESQNAITVADHMQYTPGVDVMKTGLASSNVVIRGFNNIFSGAALTIIDNRIARVPSLRVNAYQLIPTSNYDIERMEIVRGPGSALYGPNAANGVVAIFTKSPLDMEERFSTKISAAAGFRAKGGDSDPATGLSYDEDLSIIDRGMFQTEFRHAGKISNKVGYKLSGGYSGGYDWRYYDVANEPPVGDTLVFGNVKDGNEFVRDTTIAPAPFDRDFKIQKGNADLRFDFRFTDDLELILNGGMTIASGIELTGLGAAQVENWIYTYAQARFRWKRLYVQYFLNSSNAGDTYLIPRGSSEPHQVQFLIDKSKLHVAQIQHSVEPVEKISLIYGIDGLFTLPETEGTINGRFEDEDNIFQVGGYVQAEWDVVPKLSLVGAGRVDWHNAVDGAFISPRAAIVYKPTTRHTIRGTYNRAFSSPSTLNLSLDISNGRIPNGINGRGIGNPNGYQYRYDDAGPQYISPYTSQWYTNTDNSSNYIFFDGMIDSVLGGFTASIFKDMLLPGIRGENGTINDVSNVFVDYVALSEAPGSTAERFEAAKFDLGKIRDIEPIDNEITQTWEIGYKGIIADKLFVTADFYYTKISNFVSPLVVGTASAMFNPTELFNAIQGNDSLLYYNYEAMSDLFKQVLVGQLDGNPSFGGVKNGTAYDEVVNIIMGAARQVPNGSVTPDDDKVNSDIILHYTNLGTIDVSGMDLSAKLFLTEDLSVSAAYSYVSRDKIEVPGSDGVFAFLNAPRNKTAFGLEYRSKKLGLTGRANYRWQSEFPANSAVYIGIVEPIHNLDLGVSYKLPFSLNTEISVDVSNVTNNKQRPFPGTPMMGTFMLFRLAHTFKTM